MKKTLLLFLLLPFLGFSQVIPAGTYVIGTSEPAPYKTLVTAIARINTSGISGPVTFLLKNSETLSSTLVINSSSISSTNTLTIKPDVGQNITITGNLGNSSTTSAIIKIEGSDYVTIDGSNNNTNSRNLTISNTSTANYANVGEVHSAILWIANRVNTDGALNSTIKNINFIGSNVNFTSATSAGIVMSGVNNMQTAENISNSNTTISNNSFTKMKFGIWTLGGNSLNQNLIIANNIFGSSTDSGSVVVYNGIKLSNIGNASVKNNDILGVMFLSNATETTSGIYLYNKSTNTSILANKISNVTSNARSSGIYINLTATNSGLIIANNFIRDIKTNNTNINDYNNSSAGIFLNSGADINLFYNTISLNSVQTGLSSALTLLGGTLLNIKNNIFSNTNSAGAKYAVYSRENKSVFEDIDNNNYYATTVGFLGGARTTLNDWKVATGDDANSLNVLPTFVSVTDLHLQDGVENDPLKAATSITGITTDIDNEARAISPDKPYMGADERCLLPNPAGTISGTATVCPGQTNVPYTVPAITNATTYIWSYSGLGATIINSSTRTPTITFAVNATSGNLTVLGVNACGNGTISANYAVTVSPQPTVANAGPDQSVASATSFILAANTPTVGTGVWTIVSGPSTASSQLGNTTIPGTTFTPASPGTYVLNWAISNSCGSSSDQVVIANNCVTNLLSSGNFSGDNAVWTKATTQGSIVEVNPENTYFSNNNTGATAELDSQASLRQVLTVIPGVSYTVSFLYARRSSASTPLTTGVTVKVTGGTSDIVSTGFTSTNSTAQIATFTFTATSAFIGLEFYNTLSGSSTYGTIIDDVVLLPASQVAPIAVTNPRGNFNTSSSCAGVAVALDVVNVPSSGVSYSWTGTAGAVFSATNIRNPTVIFTGSGLQQATVTVTPAGGCSVTSTTYVNVAAAPVITAPLATAVCSGSTFSSGAITSTGTNYNWSRAAVANINGGAANTGGTNIIGTGFSEVLTNSSTSPINVTYVLTPTPSSSTCTGIPYNLVITVNPSIAVPTLGAITQPNCVVPTGSIPLSGLPSSDSWTIIASPAAGLTGLTGTGETTIVGGLVAGTSYTFAVSNGTCTSPVSSNILIKSLPLVAKYNGSWTNGPPTIEQSIVFEGNYTSIGNLEGCDCTVNSGVQVTVQSGHTLKITNAVKVNTAAGTSLTFQDDASLVQVNDDALNTGNISYIRINSTTRETDYTYWSSPVAGQKLYEVSPSTPPDFFYLFNAEEDNWNYAGPSTVMDVGTGYIIRGPKIVGTPPLTFHEATFKGTPNNGKIELSGIIKDRSYLLGNPYPSALSANKFITDNSAVLDGTLYFWTHMTPIGDAVFNPGSGLYAYSSNDYATYNLTGGLATNPGSAASQSVSDKPTGEIAAGQAFFTSSRLDPTNNTIVFNNRMRLDVNDAIMDNSQFFKVNNSTKKTNTIEKHRVWLNLTNTQGAFKQMLVGYITGATNDYDSSFDGPSYNGNEFIDFYSISDNESLAIQGRALPFDENDSVPLGYSSSIEGDFSISIDEVDGLLVGQNIYLEDKLNNTIHNLTKEAYTFQTTKGTFDDRFVLRYTDKTLGTGDFDTTNTQVLVSVKNKQIKINSSVESIDKVLIFDILGKQIFSKINVGTTELVIPNLGSSEQVLIVKTLLQNGQTVTTKLIY